MSQPPPLTLRVLITASMLLGWPAVAQMAPPATQTEAAQTEANKTEAVPTAPAPTATVPTTAQATLGADSLAFLDVLARLRGAPGWRGADLNYQAAQLNWRSARLRAGLAVSVGADASAVKVPWETGDWNTGATLTMNASLGALPWSPARQAVQAAERQLQVAATDLRTARGALTLQAAQAYVSARNAVAGIALADAQFVQARRVLDVTRAQREQNLVTQEAVLDRQAALERAQAAQNQAQRGLKLAQEQLRRVLGADLSLPASAAAFGPLPDLTPAGGLTAGEGAGEGVGEALLARALSRRPEVARAQAAVADARANFDAAQLDARLPDLNASVRAGQLADAQGQPGKTVSASLNLKTGLLGVQASLPLRDTSAIPSSVALALSGSLSLLGSTKSAALEQARLGVQQAELALENARQATELDVLSRLTDYQNAAQGTPGVKTSLSRAETALGSARARLEAGLGTPLDVAQAELALAQAQDALETQQAAVALAALALAQATTDLDPFLLTTPAGGRP